MNPLIRALWRYGGMLVQPRATAGALSPREGRHDGLVLGLLFLLGVGTLEVLKGYATARATGNLGGYVMLLAAVGRVLVIPLVVVVGCETVLGRARSYRRGLCLVPLLLVASLAHELASHGVQVRAYVPEIIGGVLSVALAWRIRDAVVPQEEPE